MYRGLSNRSYIYIYTFTRRMDICIYRYTQAAVETPISNGPLVLIASMRGNSWAVSMRHLHSPAAPRFAGEATAGISSKAFRTNIANASTPGPEESSVAGQGCLFLDSSRGVEGMNTKTLGRLEGAFAFVFHVSMHVWLEFRQCSVFISTKHQI